MFCLLQAQENFDVTSLDAKQYPPTFWNKFLGLSRIRLILWRQQLVRWFIFVSLSIGVLFVAAWLQQLLFTVLVNKDDSDRAYDLSLSGTPMDVNQYQTSIFTSQANPLIVRAPSVSDYNSFTMSLSSTNMKYAQLPTNFAYADLASYGGSLPQIATYYAGAEIDNWPAGSSAQTTQAKYTVWYNGTFIHSLPIAMNMINSMFYNTMMSNVQPAASGKRFVIPKGCQKEQ